MSGCPERRSSRVLSRVDDPHVAAVGVGRIAMDYEREDRIATRRGYASLESARRVQAGDYPYTILEACHVLGLDNLPLYA